MLRRLLALSVLLVVYPIGALHAVDLAVWFQYIGEDLTGIDELVTTVYCPDSGYSTYSIVSGYGDYSDFSLHSATRTITTNTSLAQGDYSIRLGVSNRCQYLPKGCYDYCWRGQSGSTDLIDDSTCPPSGS